MCIIIVKQANVELPPARMIQHLWTKNPDGAGFCVARNGKVHGYKGYMEPESLIVALNEIVKKEEQAIIHLRVGTHGPKNASATHPFPASANVGDLMSIDWESNYGIAHNGVISGYGEKTYNGLSDTQDYIKKRLHDSFLLHGLFTKRQAITDIVTDDITTDRLAIMRHDGVIITVGRFHQWNGLFFSNTGFDSWNYRTATKEKKERGKLTLEEEKKRYNKAIACPGRPKTDVPEEHIYGTDDGEIWYPVTDEKESHIVSAEGSFDYDKRYRSPASQRVCENCKRLVDVDDVLNFKGKKCCRHCFTDLTGIETTGKLEVRYETLRMRDGKRFTGTILFPKGSGGKSLVQCLSQTAKDTVGKTDWYVTAKVVGRQGDQIEVWSSARCYAREILHVGTFAENQTVADLLRVDGFFVCPETNIVLNECVFDCTKCIHCLCKKNDVGKWELICKSHVAPKNDNATVGFRVVIGAELEDIDPKLIMPDTDTEVSAVKKNEEDDNR